MYKVNKTYLLVLMGNLLALGSFAQSEVHRSEAIATNGPVYFADHSNDYTMLSGDFNEVGPYAGGGVLLDATTGQLVSGMPKVNGYIETVIPDGQGGWYIGGRFRTIGDFEVENLAHIKADKTVDTDWTPNPDYEIYTLAREGTTLYVGGYFTTIAGESRNNAAAFDLATGELTAWNPNPNNSVLTIVPSGSTIYLGGYFTSVGGQVRSYLAAVNTGTGNATPFAPTLNGGIYSIAITGSTVFAGGYYTQANGQPRASLAAFNATNGALLPWSANLSTWGSVDDLALSAGGNTLYVGGSFTSINSIGRTNLAAVHTTTGVVSSWNPVAESTVRDFDIVGNTMYVAGYFYQVNGISRPGFAAISLTDASLLSWDPNSESSGTSISVSDGQVFAGGDFVGMGWESRRGFLLMESTGNLWPHELDFGDGMPQVMAIKDNVLYIGGRFTEVNGEPRKNLAAVNLSTGQVLNSWTADVAGTTATFDNTVVNSMEISGDALYIGGIFLNVKNVSRANLAALDLTAGAPLAWNPTVGDGKTTSQYVTSIDVTGNTVYVAGNFALLGKEPRDFIGAVHATTGVPTSWAPEAVAPVEKIRVTATTAYVLGDFSKGIGGAVRMNRIAGIDLTTALATSWNPDLTSEAADFALTSSDIYVGGYFDRLGNNDFRPGLASFSLETGALNDWTPDLGDGGEGNYNVNVLAASSSRLFVGGGFQSVGNELRQYYAEYDLCAPATLSVNGSTLTASTGESYQWYVNGEAVEGATSQTFESSLIENGVYAVSVTVGGCTQRSGDYVYLITDSDSDKPSLARIYPNPVKDELFIEVPTSAELTVFDLMGRPVKTAELSFAGPNRVETDELKSGPYVLLIRTGNTTNTYKILKTY